MKLKECILQKVKDEDVLNVYHYGSFVYETNDYKSDNDYIVVVKNGGLNNQEFKMCGNDIFFLSEDTFQKHLNEHKIKALECLFLPKEFIILERKKFKFSLNKNILKAYLLEKSDDSYNIAKEKEFHTREGLKSLMHSLRILAFGIQICLKGKIEEFKFSKEFEELKKSPELYFWKEKKKLIELLASS